MHIMFFAEMVVPIPCIKNSKDADLFYAPVFEMVMMEQVES